MKTRGGILPHFQVIPAPAQRPLHDHPLPQHHGPHQSGYPGPHCHDRSACGLGDAGGWLGRDQADEGEGEMTAQKLISPCRSCDWKGDRDREECLECQPREDYISLLENRPAVDLAQRQIQRTIEMCRLMSAVTNSHKGSRNPRIEWTDEMVRTALEARRQGLSLEATAAIIGVGRKGLVKRLREAEKNGNQ